MNVTRLAKQGCNNIVISRLYRTCWDNLATSLIISTTLLQAVNNLEQAWWHYQTCYKLVLTSLIQSWYSRTVTRLTKQGCSNIVISWLYRTCWNNLATSLIISTRLFQAVNNLWQAWWHYQTRYKVVLTSLIQSWYNINITMLTTQGCNNVVISRLYRTCWNNLGTNLIISTSLLQAVNNVWQAWWHYQTCY
jgi:hypothetical protein